MLDPASEWHWPRHMDAHVHDHAVAGSEHGSGAPAVRFELLS